MMNIFAAVPVTRPSVLNSSAGPVIVYGISASVIYGLILCLIG